MKRFHIKYFESIYILIIILFFAGCGGGKHKETVSISGKFVFSRGETLYLKEILVFENAVLDSVKLNENGEFSFKIPVKDASILWLGTSEDNYITLVCEQGETPELSGDIRSLPATYTVKGSPGSEKLLELHLYTLKHYELFDSLSAIWEQGKYDKDKLALRDSLDSIARGVYQAQEEYVKQFVENNMESLTAILALYQVFGRAPVLDEFKYLDLYDQTAQSLKLKYPTNQHVNELSARVSKNKALQKEKEEITKRLLPGNPVPELSLPDREGSPVSVADYKGYALLLYFWSSTDPKCRKMNPELLTLQKKYEAKGFSLFSISLDNNPDIWEKAITLDKLPGVHVIDQRGWSSPVINMFNIESIPHTILIDKEGIIIGNNLNFEEINTRLHETVSANRNP